MDVVYVKQTNCFTLTLVHLNKTYRSQVPGTLWTLEHGSSIEEMQTVIDAIASTWFFKLKEWLYAEHNIGIGIKYLHTAKYHYQNEVQLTEDEED